MKTHAVWATILIIVLLVGVGVYIYRNQSGMSYAPQTDNSYTEPQASSSANYVSFSGHNGCAGCVLLEDSGKSISVAETSRLSIELPEAKYDSKNLTIVPNGLMGETFGAGSAPGNWVRTFEAVMPGIATITVPGRTATTTPFVLYVQITGPS